MMAAPADLDGGPAEGGRGPAAGGRGPAAGGPPPVEAQVVAPGRPGLARLPARPPALVSVRRAVGAFLAVGLVVVVALGVVLGLVQQRAATQEAIREACELTERQADVLAASLTSDALVPGPAQDALDELVRQRILGDRIVRVKIWAEDGRIVYSDDRQLVGHRFTLGQEELAALRTGSSFSEVTDLEEAENVGEAQHDKLLQVYLGLRTPDGQPLLFETYQPYDQIDAASRRLWGASLPVLLGGLLVLYLVQAPLAYRMASRLRATQEERERLLVASLAAADRERSQIVSDLHDGVVQGLAGASYTLSATAVEVRSAGQPRLADTVHSTAVDLRHWVRELRSLIVSVAPPGARRQGLEPALVDLMGVLDTHGVSADLSVEGDLDLEEAPGSLVYRVVQEAVRNVARHASAARVEVRVRVEDDVLELTISDDGRGFAPDLPAVGGDGLGLELLSALAAAHGGRLEVRSVPDTGTVVRLVLPVRSAAPSEREVLDLLTLR